MVVWRIEIHHLVCIVSEDTDPVCYSMNFHYGKRRTLGGAGGGADRKQRKTNFCFGWQAAGTANHVDVPLNKQTKTNHWKMSSYLDLQFFVVWNVSCSNWLSAIFRNKGHVVLTDRIKTRFTWPMTKSFLKECWNSQQMRRKEKKRWVKEIQKLQILKNTEIKQSGQIHSWLSSKI